MRIVHYHPDMLAGESGPATAAREWVGAIANADVPAAAILDRGAMRLPPPEGAECVALRHVGRGPARVPAGLSSVLARGDILVLHGGWLMRNVLAGGTAGRRSIPFVINAHAVYDPHVFEDRAFTKKLWAAAFERRLLRRSLAVHLFFAEECSGLERLGVDVPTIVAPNGIAAPDARWDGGSGGYVLWLGRYSIRHKGLDLLLRAMHRLPAAERPQVRLHGPDWRGQQSSVRSLIEALDLAGSVKVGEPVYGQAKWDLIGGALGCVYPSRWEGCSLSVLESIAAGVPTLVTPFAMGRSLASDGAVVASGWSADEVADGLRRLVSSDAAAIGARAAEVARTRFSWPSVARSWLDQVEGFTRASRSSSSDGR